MKKEIADIRKDYQLKNLLETEVAPNPYTQFSIWWNQAIESNIDEVNAMTLATATTDGVPSARIVLLKSVEENGFVFFTNYHSRKGTELDQNPKACLVFFWKELERQVRISGTVKKLDAASSDEYFQSRPYGSRIAAWASPQSKVIASREVLEKNIQEAEKKYTEDNIVRPQNWGGYIVEPTIVEFWQGRHNRLHDRIQYTLLNSNSWKIERLAP